MQVIWTDPALERAEEIAVYIAADDREAAVRWTVELFDTVEHIADFPEMGRVVPELGQRAKSGHRSQLMRLNVSHSVGRYWRLRLWYRWLYLRRCFQ